MVVEIKRTNEGQKKDIKCNEEWKKTSFVCEVGKFQDIQMCIRRSIWCCWTDPAEWSLGMLHRVHISCLRSEIKSVTHEASILNY